MRFHLILAWLVACVACALPAWSAPTHAASSLVASAPFTAERTVDGLVVRNRDSGKVIVDHVRRVYPPDDSGVYVFVLMAPDASRSPFGHTGVIGADGTLLFKPVYDDIDIYDKRGLVVVKKDDKKGLFRIDGTALLPIKYHSIGGLMYRDHNGAWPIKINGKVGLVDPSTGKLVAPIKYARIRSSPGRKGSEEGFLIATLPASEGRKKRVYDWKGQPIPGVGTHDDFSVWPANGWLVIDQAWAVDHDGNQVIAPGAYDQLSYKGNRAIVWKNHLYGIIDAKGKIRVPVKYPYIARMSGKGGDKGWFRYTLSTKGNMTHWQFGVLDGSNGQIILQAIWDGVELHEADEAGSDKPSPYFLVHEKKHFGSVDVNGNVILAPTFSTARPLSQSSALYQVKRDGKSGVCNFVTGACPLKPHYDLLKHITAGVFLALDDGRNSVRTLDGAVLIKPTSALIQRIPNQAPRMLMFSIGTGPSVRTRAFKFDRPSHAWKATDAHVDLERALAHAHDGNPMIRILGATITARYLPREFATASAVLKGYRQGKLRELAYPSLQLSAKRAFVFFGNIRSVHETLPNTFRLCRDDDGFRLPLDSHKPCDTGKPSAGGGLHFVTTDGGKTLQCADCKAFGIPSDWVRKSAPADADTGKD